jgi:hypothetical protein
MTTDVYGMDSVAAVASNINMLERKTLLFIGFPREMFRGHLGLVTCPPLAVSTVVAFGVLK